MRPAPFAPLLAALVPVAAWLLPSWVGALGIAFAAPAPKPEPLPTPEVALAIDTASSLGGPNGWVLTVKNNGTAPLRLTADARLLRLFVTPPAPSAVAKGKPKPAAPKTLECVLPSSMREEGRSVVLPPGARYVEAFDPRLYCLDTKVEPGSSVSARLGFPAGKAKVLEAPFVVVPVGSGLASVKELAAPSWIIAEPSTPAPGVGASASTSAAVKPWKPLSASAGGARSVADVSGAEVTIHVKNTSTTAVTLYARPQLVDVRVVGPRGFPVACNGPIVQPAPIVDFVGVIGVGQTWSATVPLAGLCPPHTFDVPGLYLLTPMLRAPALSKTLTGNAKNVFAGEVVAEAPQLLRIETGKKPFHDVPPIALSASAK